MTTTVDDEVGMRYEFGKNWADYISSNFDEQRIDIAEQHILNFIKLDNLEGRVFLDIGCGSGIHSLAAYRAGADKVLSFDFDEHSVRTTRSLRRWAGDPENWFVRQGSVLDKSFLDTLERADIVYSWGVLHHTGSMWQAIENAASLMKPDGVLYIALYTSDVFIDPPPEYWLRIKQDYNRASSLKRRCMELGYALHFTIIPELRARQNPLKRILSQRDKRGMSYWTDVRDWLGGWPMEFAGIAETENFCVSKLGLEVLNVNAGEANSEYLFRKRGAVAYWDTYVATRHVEPLTGPFAALRGNAWVAELPQLSGSCDTPDQPRRSRLMLFEDGVPVGFAHQPHAYIEAHGGGRYSHWAEQLIFSATDNSDPNSNGKRYEICADML